MDTSLEQLIMAANQGDADAQCELGFIYEEGDGVQQDHAEAARWFRLAADQDDAMAQISLGDLYAHGDGVQQSDAEALQWYRRAVDQSEPLACYRLGLMYYNGWGVKQDYAKALRLFVKSTQERDGTVIENADILIGDIYFHGLGTAQSLQEAKYWYFRAAERGLSGAQEKLSRIINQH